MTSLTGLHDDLRALAADVFARNPQPDWQALTRAGWPGLEVPESCGGAGVSFAEVAVVLEESGRAAASDGYLGGAVLAGGALNAIKPDKACEELLAALAEGTERIAVALPADGPAAESFRFDGVTVTGSAQFVADAGAATTHLLPSVTPEGSTAIIALPAGAAGLTVTPQPVVDATRRPAAVAADQVRVDPLRIWRFTDAHDAGHLIDRARIALACDSLGLAEAMLARTVSYTAVRRQFDRPVGSFQAVKHACADMMVDIAVGRRLVAAAVDALVTGSAQTKTAAAMAKAHVCEMAVDVTGKAMQLHGGIGYTWESDIHVYLKRAAFNRSWFGSPSAIRRELALRYHE